MIKPDRYLAPEGYYENTKDGEPRPLLIEAVELLQKHSSMSALDIGCGAGRDTRYLLEQGFSVVAVEGNEEAQKYLQSLPHQENLTFVQTMIQNFEFDQYDIINASHVLQFLDRTTFDEVFNEIKSSLKPNGLFVGQFLGVNDQWNKPGSDMTFLTKPEALVALEGLKILDFAETDEQGKLANGDEKHWHKFSIIAQKAP